MIKLSNIKLLILFLLLPVTSQIFAIEVIDDIGRRIKLESPAKRIISLAPHITENLFSAGIGDRVVGTVNFSDYPEQAKSITQVGGYNNINIEKIISLQPDIIIAWKEGNQKSQIDKLIALSIPVYINEPTRLEDIASDIKRFGIIADNEDEANKNADYFLTQLKYLESNYAEKSKISVFYQVWHNPLITVNHDQIIGHIIELCGGNNIFANLTALTPKISVEAVIASNPQVIIASGMDQSRPEWLDDWRKWDYLTAVKEENLFFINPDIIQRHTMRMLIGAEQMCTDLDNVRETKY